MSRIYIDDNYCLARPVKIFYLHKFGSWEKRDASYEVGVDICWEWLYPGNRNSSMQTSLFFGLTLWTILMHYQIIYLANKIVKMLATVSCRIKWVALISCFDFSFRFVFCRIPLWTFQFLRPFRSFKTDNRKFWKEPLKKYQDCFAGREKFIYDHNWKGWLRITKHV